MEKKIRVFKKNVMKVIRLSDYHTSLVLPRRCLIKQFSIITVMDAIINILKFGILTLL